MIGMGRTEAESGQSKLALIIDLLRRADGATIVDLTQATGLRTRRGQRLPGCASGDMR